MYENIECETLSVENIYWQSATIGIFFKKIHVIKWMERFANQKIAKKDGYFLWEKPSSANEWLTYLLT